MWFVVWFVVFSVTHFSGYSDTHSVQENFSLITSFIQDSADKHIPSKNSRSVSSVVSTLDNSCYKKEDLQKKCNSCKSKNVR